MRGLSESAGATPQMSAFNPRSIEEARATYKGLRRSAIKPKASNSAPSGSLRRRVSARSTKAFQRQEGGNAAQPSIRKSSPRRTRTARQKAGDALDAQWRTAVRERDNFTCRWPGCGYSSRHIHAHHIHTKKQRPDLRRSPKNGAAVCPLHHDFLHHTVEGRQKAREIGLLGTTTYELAMKEKR